MYSFSLLVFNYNFEFQNFVCNGCHDLTMFCLNFGDVSIISTQNVDYCSIIHDISKSDAIHLLENSLLDDRGYIYKMHINIKNNLN